MVDRTIPFYNTILRCDRYRREKVKCPEGYAIATYRDGFEKGWARLEFATGDFETEDEAEAYFKETYLRRESDRQKILFALDKQGVIVGSCIAWRDNRGDGMVKSLHWLVVDEAHQRHGIGRALCRAVMELFAEEGNGPVYIHTQPWSWKAILLYILLGFRLQKTDSFSRYVNQYDRAMETLKGVVTERQYAMMEEASDA